MTPAQQSFASLSAEATCALCANLAWLRYALSQAQMSP